MLLYNEAVSDSGCDMLKYVVVVVFIFCSSMLQAEVPITKQVSEPVDVALYFGTGMISFRDLYLPLSNTDPFVPHLRADGNIREADSLNHFGVAVECGLALRYHLERYLLSYHLGYRRAGSLGIDGLYADSSYANTFTGVKVFYTTNAKVMPGFGLAVQRVAFSNLSISHTVMSLLPTAELQLPLSADLTINGFLGYAMWNRLGYASNTQFLGTEFTRATVKTWNIGASARRKLNINTSVVFAASREHIAIHLNDINTYKKFGLTLFAEEPTPRDIPLHTSTISLSLQRDF